MKDVLTLPTTLNANWGLNGYPPEYAVTMHPHAGLPSCTL